MIRVRGRSWICEGHCVLLPFRQGRCSPPFSIWQRRAANPRSASSRAMSLRISSCRARTAECIGCASMSGRDLWSSRGFRRHLPAVERRNAGRSVRAATRCGVSTSSTSRRASTRRRRTRSSQRRWGRTIRSSAIRRKTSPAHTVCLRRAASRHGGRFTSARTDGFSRSTEK